MESCPAKTVIAGTMGFALGGVFGLFMSSMRYDTPLSAGLPGGVGTTSDLPMRQQLKAGLKDMGRASWSSARNFGYIGAVFAGTECAIEGLRAKNDLANGVAAGCLTGGWLARSGGPQAVAVGCAGFAAFSAAIDAYMRMPQDDKAADPII
jgi:mitochondrial import inner membrane translocase subunit TIM22